MDVEERPRGGGQNARVEVTGESNKTFLRHIVLEEDGG